MIGERRVALAGHAIGGVGSAQCHALIDGDGGRNHIGFRPAPAKRLVKVHQSQESRQPDLGQRVEVVKQGGLRLQGGHDVRGAREHLGAGDVGGLLGDFHGVALQLLLLGGEAVGDGGVVDVGEGLHDGLAVVGQQLVIAALGLLELAGELAVIEDGLGGAQDGIGENRGGAEQGGQGDVLPAAGAGQGDLGEEIGAGDADIGVGGNELRFRRGNVRAAAEQGGG